MRYSTLSIVIFLLGFTFNQSATAQSPEAPKDFDSIIEKLQRTDGFIPFYYDEAKDQLLLEVDSKLGDFIYVTSLASGLGSNDIGLDRGQLGGTRIVRFRKTGGKLLLEQPNLDYRALSDNPAERASVAEAFASSILAGFPILASKGDLHLIDLTPFVMQDAYGVGERLRDGNQGNYKFDKLRSALFMERTKNFPLNTEFEAIITLSGKAKGRELRSVTPTSSAVTTRQHHSFVALPDDGYKTRVFDPRAGYSPLQFADYASKIGTPLNKRLIRRHRLEKKNPSADLSEAVEPIVYYVDRGAPEPVKSALIEGASWWNEAFEAAGFKDAFRVEVLPKGVDPLDVRYNVIQWVHRSTRGWSYGSSVYDPRTGEIIKGHVSLGSLRIRQDFLIAQGLIDGYKDGVEDPRLLAFALDRLRQLSAHEVGHTIGLAHNFAASAVDRASVMDYPHPYVTLNDKGVVDLSDAYAVGIGIWDKQAIRYGYLDVNANVEGKMLSAVLVENKKLGLPFISDADARAKGGAHPTAHLWDNGKDATEELARIITLRRYALDNLDLNNLAPGQPVAELENVFAPVYLMHRYQVEAAVKLVGGYNYAFDLNDDSVPSEVRGSSPKSGASAKTHVTPVDPTIEQNALRTILQTLQPSFLKHEVDLIPQPFGYRRGRELFDAHTGPMFDDYAAAEASIDLTLGLLLAPERVTRILQKPADDKGVTGQVLAKALISRQANGNKLDLLLTARLVEHALRLASDDGAPAITQAWALALATHAAKIPQGVSSAANPQMKSYLMTRLEQWHRDPANFSVQKGARIPDGSPIGCGDFH
ncbi:MAG: zinc-dependent metalloprotease [Saprospiraceae bacterium]